MLEQKNNLSDSSAAPHQYFLISSSTGTFPLSFRPLSHCFYTLLFFLLLLFLTSILSPSLFSIDAIETISFNRNFYIHPPISMLSLFVFSFMLLSVPFLRLRCLLWRITDFLFLFPSTSFTLVKVFWN